MDHYKLSRTRKPGCTSWTIGAFIRIRKAIIITVFLDYRHRRHSRNVPFARILRQHGPNQNRTRHHSDIRSVGGRGAHTRITTLISFRPEFEIIQDRVVWEKSSNLLNLNVDGQKKYFGAAKCSKTPETWSFPTRRNEPLMPVAQHQAH